jgi:hypothetical protein
MSLAVWIERFSAGAKGAGYALYVNVWDLGSSDS